MSWLSPMAATAGRVVVRLVPPARRDWAEAVWAEAHEVPAGWQPPGPEPVPDPPDGGRQVDAGADLDTPLSRHDRQDAQAPPGLVGAGPTASGGG
jgi:hypothetical protein